MFLSFISLFSAFHFTKSREILARGCKLAKKDQLGKTGQSGQLGLHLGRALSHLGQKELMARLSQMRRIRLTGQTAQIGQTGIK